LIERDPFGHPLCDAEAVECGAGHDDDIKIPAVDLCDPFLDVPSNGFLDAVGECSRAIGFAPFGTDADDRIFRQLRNRASRRQDEGIARFFAPGKPEPVDAFGQGDGQILCAVNGQVDLPAEQGVVEFLGEEVGRAFAQVRGAVGVADRADFDLLKEDAVEQGLDAVECVARLGQGQPTGPGARP